VDSIVAAGYAAHPNMQRGEPVEDHPNAALARRALESLNTGDMQAMSDLLADDIEWHEIGRAEPIRGKAALAARFMEGGASGDTIQGKLHDVVANDEHTIALVEATATRGGQTFTYRTAEIMHTRDGKVTARWAFSDDTDAINKFFA
jgi:ketosteroid isomerase-like protein